MNERRKPSWMELDECFVNIEIKGMMSVEAEVEDAI